jgi:hypothetical protein
MARRHVGKRAGRRRLVRLSAVSAATAGLVVVVGAPRVTLLVVAVAMVWGLVRWPRIEDRLFRPRPGCAVVPVRAEVWSRPVVPPGGGVGFGVEVHRAYAQALHAVTGAYLAECEREAQR